MRSLTRIENKLVEKACLRSSFEKFHLRSIPTVRTCDCMSRLDQSRGREIELDFLFAFLPLRSERRDETMREENRVGSRCVSCRCCFSRSSLGWCVPWSCGHSAEISCVALAAQLMACGMWVCFGYSLAGHLKGSIRLASQLTPIRGHLEGSIQRPRAASPRVTGVIPQSNPSESLPQLEPLATDRWCGSCGHAAACPCQTVFVGHSAPYEAWRRVI